MKKLRQKVINAERKVGNFFYDGLGDILTTEISKKGLTGLGLITCLGLSGCATSGKEIREINEYDAAEIIGKYGAANSKSNLSPKERLLLGLLSNKSGDLARRKHERELMKEEQDLINRRQRAGRSYANEYPLMFTKGQKEDRIKEIFRRGEIVNTYANIKRTFPRRVNFPLAFRIIHLDSGRDRFDIVPTRAIDGVYEIRGHSCLIHKLPTKRNVPVGEYEAILYGDPDRDGDWERILGTRFAIFE